MLPSGEACIKISNSVIEKNRKSWEPFVQGQFYSDPPSQGTLHNIVNGIWSKYYRDISVSKLEGFAFLFCIPNAATRHIVITQAFGKLKARLFGHPTFLHPATANKTNLEVAKVFTVINPRQPLPEAVNVQFDSRDISRVLVSSPWMPPVFGFCKEVGQMITVEVTWPSAQTSSFISVIYAANVAADRSILWSEINALAVSHSLDSKPWLVIGDFNQIRDPAEHSKVPTLNMDKNIRDFNQCLLVASLEDLNFRGTTFTWWNKRKLAPLAKKLDRALVNDEWYYMFPSSVAFFGIPDFSDHAVIAIPLEPSFEETQVTEECYQRAKQANHSGIEKKTALAHEKMLEAQTVMLSSPSVSNASFELQAVKDWEEYAASRQGLNHIHFLISSSGERVESQTGIQELCVIYFSDLLGSPKPFTADDIKNAFFSLPRNKTGGPDEVTEAILEFFKSGCLLKQWNSANLVLIPKKPNASLTTDFRPISCLNTVYKVISKLLASRLKAILPLMVSKAQSAFRPGRLLAENVLLATDLVKGYNTQALSPRGMLKVDLRKAFDCVRWDFILSSLRALAIPESYICLITECLSTASFSVSVNGISGGFFKSTKGITQRDPLSPYLFVLAMECLSRLLLSRYEMCGIGYHPGTEHLKISHLMFADDVMVFFDGTSNSHSIAECLDDFASWSGLHMSFPIYIGD
ncbi:uncharacterized protein LOC125582291 [Brassica napus]|uniref:uncharacterized protein LOC125582291 n=1 Tax=Brassica napus TaxID=3708 RepID=UPI0020787AA0|nr:uncharacterized protein LOC125582291 [Brassica napus]